MIFGEKVILIGIILTKQTTKTYMYYFISKGAYKRPSTIERSNVPLTS